MRSSKSESKIRKVKITELERIRMIASEPRNIYDGGFTHHISIERPDGSIEITSIARAFLNAILYKNFLQEDRVYVTDKVYMSDESLGDTSVNKVSLNRYIQRYIDMSSEMRLPDLQVDVTLLYNGFNEMLNHYEDKVTMNFSTWDLVNLAKDPVLCDLITKELFSDSMTPIEIGEVHAKYTKILKDRLEETKVEPFYTLLRSGGGMRIPQLQEILIGIGMSAVGRDKAKISHLNSMKWLRGVRTKTEYFIEQQKGRVALLISKVLIANAVDTSKKILMTQFHNEISEDLDCGTSMLLDYKIDNEQDLSNVAKLNMLTDKGDLVLVTTDMVELIGTTIKVRTPYTCNGDKICRTCLGGFYEDMTSRDGMLGEHMVQQNPFVHLAMRFVGIKSQAMLNAKHLTRSIMMDMDLSIDGDTEEEFYHLEFKDLIIDVEFDKVVLYDIHDRQENEIKCKGLTIYKDGKTHGLNYSNDNMFINVTFDEEDVIEEEDGELTEFTEITLKKSRSDILFNVDLPNNTITAMFASIKSVFSTQHLDIVEPITKFREIYGNTHFIVYTSMARPALRRISDPFLRPDFNELELEDWIFLPTDQVLSKANIESRLPLGNFNDFLSNLDTYGRKDLITSTLNSLYDTYKTEDTVSYVEYFNE